MTDDTMAGTVGYHSCCVSKEFPGVHAKHVAYSDDIHIYGTRGACIGVPVTPEQDQQCILKSQDIGKSADITRQCSPQPQSASTTCQSHKASIGQKNLKRCGYGIIYGLVFVLSLPLYGVIEMFNQNALKRLDDITIELTEWNIATAISCLFLLNAMTGYMVSKAAVSLPGFLFLMAAQVSPFIRTRTVVYVGAATFLLFVTMTVIAARRCHRPALATSCAACTGLYLIVLQILATNTHPFVALVFGVLPLAFLLRIPLDVSGWRCEETPALTVDISTT